MANTSPRPFVFVLMPFTREFDDIYQLGIKPACLNAGTYAERVDEQLFHESILDRIYNQIAKADIIIADMTGRNPNVFYEAGYAHALNKAVILMTQKADDIPFDLKHYPHIIYEGRITDLIPEIEKRVKHLIQKPNQKYIPEKTMEFYVDGVSLSEGVAIENKIKNQTTNRFYLKLDAHNPITNIIQVQRFQLGIETSARFDRSITKYFELERGDKLMNIVKQPNNRFLHLLADKFEILPGAWATIHIELIVKNIHEQMEIGYKEKFILRMFTENGVFEFPFDSVVTQIDK